PLALGPAQHIKLQRLLGRLSPEFGSELLSLRVELGQLLLCRGLYLLRVSPLLLQLPLQALGGAALLLQAVLSVRRSLRLLVGVGDGPVTLLLQVLVSL